MKRVLIACVGGFLGAGKTTAIVGAARELISRDLCVGVITNDQGSHLVDSAIMHAMGLPMGEIAGGCFCCRFDDLVASAERIVAEHSPDIILAEAVGSCTDLLATVCRPLQRYHADRFDLAPLSVLVEPDRLRGFLASEGELGEDVAYLFEKQLAEASLIILNKSDLIDDGETERLTGMLGDRIGDTLVLCMSARTGDGVTQWIDQLLGSQAGAGRPLDIDYETYARAEASLGWLNATIDLLSSQKFAPRRVTEVVAQRIREKCAEAGAAIAHVKILIATGDGCDRISMTSNDQDAEWSGKTALSPVCEASMVLNARVSANPEMLSRAVEDVLMHVAGEEQIRMTVQDTQAFAPSPPKPRYRLQPDLDVKR